MDATQGEGVRTVDQVRAARIPFQGNVPGVGRSLELGELEEIEANAQAGQMADPSQVLAMVRTIQSLARRTYVRFTQMVEAQGRANEVERRAEELANKLSVSYGELQIRDARTEVLNSRVSDLSEWLTLRDGELASANEQRDAARREVEELKQSLAARDSLLAEATKERDEARRERDARYTKEQVGDFQASEAELVSAPLRRQVEELRKALAETRRQRDERYTKGDLDRHFARHVQRADYWAKVVSDISAVLSTRTARTMAEVIRQIRDILEKPMEGPPGPPEAQ